MRPPLWHPPIELSDAEASIVKRTKKIDGSKRHILKDLESGIVCAVALTRANTPEATATVDLERAFKSKYSPS